MQVLIISINLEIQLLFLRYLQDNLSGLEDDELLHFLMACKSSSLEKEAHVITSLNSISSNRLVLNWWLWVELNDLCSILYRSDNLMYGWPSNWIASIAGSFILLTQFISSQDLHFLLTTLSILLLKNLHFVLLTVPSNFFQSLSCLVCLYVLRSLLQLLSYQALECLVMLTILECLCHMFSVLLEIV